MRVPGSVRGSISAYLSMRAALVALVQHNAAGRPPIRSMAVPGLGTGVGGMAPDAAAGQMRAAYDNVIGGEWRDVVHPIQAPYAFGTIRRALRPG
jgi:O-acetyl-ADP-ribose deacetylase (regulator of RNase III)